MKPERDNNDSAKICLCITSFNPLDLSRLMYLEIFFNVVHNRGLSSRRIGKIWRIV